MERSGIECAYNGCHRDGSRRVMVTTGARTDSLFVCPQHALLLEDLMNGKKKCALGICDKPSAAKGVCQVHYQRWFYRRWLEGVEKVTPEMAEELHARWERETEEKRQLTVRQPPPAATRPPKKTHPDVLPPQRTRRSGPVQAPPAPVPAEQVEQVTPVPVEQTAAEVAPVEREPVAPVVSEEAGLADRVRVLEARERELEAEVAQLRRLDEDAAKAREAIRAANPSLPAGSYSGAVIALLNERTVLIGDLREARELISVAQSKAGWTPDAPVSFVHHIEGMARKLEKLAQDLADLSAASKEDSATIIAVDAALDKAGVTRGYFLPTTMETRKLTLAKRVALLAERAAQPSVEPPAPSDTLRQATSAPAPDSLLVSMLHAPDLRAAMVEALVVALRARLERANAVELSDLLTGPASRVL